MFLHKKYRYNSVAYFAQINLVWQAEAENFRLILYDTV
jgi:hypothetical protein